MPPPPHIFLPLEWGALGQLPRHHLVPGLGVMVLSQCQVLKRGLALSSSHSCLLPSPHRGSLKNSLSSVLNCLILPLPMPLQPRGGSGRLSLLSNPHFT